MKVFFKNWRLSRIYQVTAERSGGGTPHTLTQEILYWRFVKNIFWSLIASLLFLFWLPVHFLKKTAEWSQARLDRMFNSIPPLLSVWKTLEVDGEPNIQPSRSNHSGGVCQKEGK